MSKWDLLEGLEASEESEERHQARARLVHDPMLPIRVILNPEEYRGLNPLGEWWPLWAVGASQEAALAILVRPDYLSAAAPLEAEQNALFTRAFKCWPAAREWMLGEKPELLLRPLGDGLPMAYHAAEGSASAALHLLRDPRWACFRLHPEQPAVLDAALAHWPVAARLVAELPHLGRERLADGRLVFEALVQDSPSLVPAILRLPGVAMLRLSSGETLGEKALERNWARLENLLAEDPALARLAITEGELFAHGLARRSESFAVGVVEKPDLASLRNAQGETVAHAAVRRWSSAAAAVLPHPDIAELRDGEGVTVRRVALAHPSVGSFSESMQARLQGLLERFAPERPVEGGKREGVRLPRRR